MLSMLAWSDPNSLHSTVLLHHFNEHIIAKSLIELPYGEQLIENGLVLFAGWICTQDPIPNTNKQVALTVLNECFALLSLEFVLNHSPHSTHQRPGLIDPAVSRAGVPHG
jgi:hypothetical protein